MKKSKLIFAIIAVCTILTCVICAVVMGQRNVSAPETAVTENTTDTEPSVIVPDNTPQETISAKPVDAPVIVKDDVTITQLPKDPDEVIERMPITDPEHPEVLDIESTSPMMSSEGSVYRNDKEISIEIVDNLTGDVYDFSFGHATGKCNRFLYLNPQFKVNDEELSSNVYYHFSEPYGGGTVTTCGIPVEENIDNKLYLNYSFFRALEEKQVAGYSDPKHPGTIWFTQSPLDNNIYIDVTAHYYQGGLIATMRLTIAKDKDGTYSIVDIDNKDLLSNGENDTYSLRELAYVIDVADTVFHTPGMNHTFNTNHLDWHFQVEECIIELRDAETGLYWNEFIPAEGSKWTRDYSDSQMPILAVNVTKLNPTQTHYYMVLEEPTATTHGTYQYVGYDYPLYETVQLLNGYLYEGQG